MGPSAFFFVSYTAAAGEKLRAKERLLDNGALTKQMVNLKCSRKVKSDGCLGQVIECLVGRLQRDILGALGHQETWIPWDVYSSMYQFKVILMRKVLE